MDTGTQAIARVEAHIRGAVQGVGFRPFVYRLALELGLAGTVANTVRGVEIVAEGPRATVDAFLDRLQREPPPLSIVEAVEHRFAEPAGLTTFRIVPGETTGEAAAHILPDIATCPDCLREIRDPADRRYRYPFTNCTHCGPRFSIILRLPYDRPNTSMARFALCLACRLEYEDPADRRFHAQPTACPACGPRLALWDGAGGVIERDGAALPHAVELLRAGRIVAVKGLGGFHLMCDARNAESISRLRAHKRREEKPFAILFPHLAGVTEACRVSPLEARLLESPEAPIVLLDRRPGACVADNAAPEAPRLGAMLPCTPLHHLLLGELGFPMVATSGNLREEPLCTDEHDALARLGGIAEAFLVHDRPIVRPVDDSIVHVVRGREQLLRRARGYAPLPIHTGDTGPPVLAVGGHHKNTVALALNGAVFLSQHVGDLETPLALDAHTAAGEALCLLYGARPERVACDAHPGYASTARARETGLPMTAVQHHYAHIVACMAEHGLDEPVLGVAWDGSGYGDDHTVWGGEFFRATRDGYTRAASFRRFWLPGGEQAVREPRRAAFSLLAETYGPDAPDLDVPPVRAFSHAERAVLLRMLDRGLNAPWTSSAGRLFDAVAALCGLRQISTFEGQAAMALEHAARGHARAEPPYPLPLRDGLEHLEIDWAPLVRAIVDDVRRGDTAGAVAARFHRALAHAILDVARRIALPAAVLSGGCFQNALLAEWAGALLEREGFRVFMPHRVPPNDGGIALGQAVHALRRMKNETE